MQQSLCAYLFSRKTRYDLRDSKAIASIVTCMKCMGIQKIDVLDISMIADDAGLLLKG